MKDHEWHCCNNDEEEKIASPLSPSLDNVWAGEKPMRSTSQYEEPDIKKALPEFSNTWGDFEGFDEFTPQAEEFCYADERLPFDDFSTITPNEGNCTEPANGQDNEWDAFTSEDENTKDCEPIFKLSFPVPLIVETNEKVKSLDAQLTSLDEENDVSKLIKSHLWLDSDELEKVRNLNGTPGVDWPTSKACRDLMTLLGMSSESTCSDKEAITDTTDFDMEQSQVNEFSTGNRSLIQTKLEVAPGSNQGHIFSYQLFLKKPSADTAMSFVTFIGKKSFFSSNRTRFNF